MRIATRDDIRIRQRERKRIVAAAAKSARQSELNLLQNMAGVGVLNELRQICDTLLTVAQKYVPHTPAAFSDADSVVRCAKSLRNMALQPEVAPAFTAAVESRDAASALNSFDYRYLRNKAIAGFATIADLTAKQSSVGTAEYQNGVREGYRRASEIAVMFLGDIESGGLNGR